MSGRSDNTGGASGGGESAVEEEGRQEGLHPLPSPAPAGVHIQVFPHSEVPLHQALSRANRNFMFKPMEFELSQGTLVKFGRKIDSKKESTSRWSRDDQIANNACYGPLGSLEAPDKDSAPVSVTEEGTPAASSSAAAAQKSCKQLIAFRSKVVSRAHAELWLGKDGQVYFKDIGSSSGTFLNRLRLSPSGKESRPYPLKSGDTVQLGVDYQGRQEEIYKCVTVKVFISSASGQRNRPKSTKMKTALAYLISAMNPHSDEGSEDPMSAGCCICLSDMEPYQALFLAPCSHCFHYKCCTPLLATGYMFQCPLCRQVANLEADVNQDEDTDDEATSTLSESENVAAGKSTVKESNTPISRAMSLPVRRTLHDSTASADEGDNEDGSQQGEGISPTSSQPMDIPSSSSGPSGTILAAQSGNRSMQLQQTLIGSSSLMTPPNNTRMLPSATEDSGTLDESAGLTSNLSQLGLNHSTAAANTSQERRQEMEDALLEYEHALNRLSCLFPNMGQDPQDLREILLQRAREQGP